jgi:hypothetical protein
VVRGYRINKILKLGHSLGNTLHFAERYEQICRLAGRFLLLKMTLHQLHTLSAAELQNSCKQSDADGRLVMLMF